MWSAIYIVAGIMVVKKMAKMAKIYSWCRRWTKLAAEQNFLTLLHWITSSGENWQSREMAKKTIKMIEHWIKSQLYILFRAFVEYICSVSGRISGRLHSDQLPKAMIIEKPVRRYSCLGGKLYKYSTVHTNKFISLILSSMSGLILKSFDGRGQL